MRIAVALLALALGARAEAVDIGAAVGQAAVAGDLHAAKERAKDDALRGCVQQATAAIVTAGAEPDQAQLLSDVIYAHALGYVRRFQVLDEGQEGSTWVTKVRCDVSEAKLEEDLMASGVAYRRAGMPRLLVLVAEQGLDARQATGWWQGGGDGAAPRVAEDAFVDRMARSGFTFADAQELQGKVKLDAIGPDPDPQQVRELGRAGGEDLVVVGRAVARPLGELALGNGTFYSAVADVTARAIRTDTGEVVATARFTGAAGRGFERGTAGRDALAEAGRRLAGDFFAKIGRVWARQRSAQRIAMAVDGIEDYARLAAFKNALARSVRGVRNVEERALGNGRAELDVTLAGTSRSFATDLATRKLQGFSVKVKRVTQGAVEVELR